MLIANFSGDFLAIAGTIFLAELTDKDALLLLSLATKMEAPLVFAAGSISFLTSTAIIVLFGSVLTAYVPIFWVKIAGGTIMLGYALIEYVRGLSLEKKAEKGEDRFAKSIRRETIYAFLGIAASLILLDLAGDATELLTIVFVAQYANLLLVFAAAGSGLVAASAVETVLGNRLGKVLSSKNVRLASILIFVVIGSVIIVSTLFGISGA